MPDPVLCLALFLALFSHFFAHEGLQIKIKIGVDLCRIAQMTQSLFSFLTNVKHELSKWRDVEQGETTVSIAKGEKAEHLAWAILRRIRIDGKSSSKIPANTLISNPTKRSVFTFQKL